MTFLEVRENLICADGEFTPRPRRAGQGAACLHMSHGMAFFFSSSQQYIVMCARKGSMYQDAITCSSPNVPLIDLKYAPLTRPLSQTAGGR